MDEGGGDGASGELRTALPDDRSDSGVSSLRSNGSGDERSGSRSSALSSSDEPTSGKESDLPPATGKESSTVRVWRDPLLATERHHAVRHVDSVQHVRLLQMSSHAPPPATPPAQQAAPHYPPPLHPHHLAPPPALYTQLPDVLWKQRYPPVLPAAEQLLERERAFAHDRDRHDRLIRDRRELEVREVEKAKEREREKLEREKQQQERDRQERIDRERLDRERIDRERIDRERLEKHRAEQAVHKHFEESLRLAQQKRNNSMCWNLINSLPPPPQEDRKQELMAAREQQRLMAAERARHDARERAYYSQQMPRPSSKGADQYPSQQPPPTAHSRASKAPPPDTKVLHSALPKAEPNFNLFYPGYQTPLSFLHHEASSKKLSDPMKGSLHQASLSPLMITKSDRDRDSQPPPLMSDVKNSVIVKNEVKSMQGVMDCGKVRHSPSPKQLHYLSQTSPSQLKPSPYEYRSPSQSPLATLHQYEPQNLASISKVQHLHRVPPPPQRQSPHPPPSPRQSPHQRHSPHTLSPHPNRQSPHPHLPSYTKPATVASYPYPSPHPQLHYPPHPPTTPPKPKVSSPAPHHIYGKPTTPLPLPLPKPPLTTSPYQPLSQHQLPPLGPLPGLAPPPPPPAHNSVLSLYPPGPNVAVSIKPPPPLSPPDIALGPHLGITAIQTQPLDLGMSRDPALSPKHKLSPLENESEAKKMRGDDEDTCPLLLRTGAVTTVANTGICTPPLPCNSPQTPVKRALDSSSPRPPTVPPATPYPVHKLKKAWLQRHSGEDVTTAEDSKDMVGSGVCVTLPLTLSPSAPPPIKKEAVTEQPPSGSISPSCVVNSLHCIGSMAVNSIMKTKTKGVANSRKSAKEGSISAVVNVLVNGHGASNKLHDADDSSSSDTERKAMLPSKRVPPKVKRKKGAIGRAKVTTAVVGLDEVKRKSKSRSSTESEKESGSDKESDSGASSKKSNGGREGTEKPVAKGKRGRRPKGTTPAATPTNTPAKNEGGEEPRPKKSRDEPPPQRDPFQKPPVGQLKKSGDSFLQDGPCFEVAPKLAKCRECRWTANQRSRNMPNIFCRFYAFRRLRYTKSGQLAIAGFSDPHRDASQDDLKLWLPMPDNPPQDLDLEMSRFLLMQVGDQFCDLLKQEKEALSIHMAEDKTIAWKRVVQGVREMCDVCETTLFNFHWACSKCGFVVCIDCYKGRKSGTIKMWGEPGRDRDELSWLLCTNRQAHEQEKLMLTQIIAGDSLLSLGRKAHEARELWAIPILCSCPSAADIKPTNGICKDLLKSIQNKSGELVNGQNKVGDSGSERKTEDKNSPLNWLADVALSKETEKKQDIIQDSGSSSESEDGNFSTLRELLIRPAHKANGSRAPSPTTAPSLATIKGKKSVTIEDVISSVIEDNVVRDSAAATVVGDAELKHFVRQFNRVKGRDPLPIRIMTLRDSLGLYPDVPHSWLCEGKLLRLMDSNNPSNYLIFQDQWKRGQPVIVSDVCKHLDMSLWHPDSFARDFGEVKNNLINCMTGNLVPNQPMRRFWEGFECVTKRLRDDRGNPMLLKLKDWPPGDDFAEMLPSRYNDLMKVLPLGEYTQRTGRLNLASRLPDCFVRPDLGPKMYTAYGSGLHPTKGTTNLHLDISDAVNVMVYVGIPKDADNDELVTEALRAVDEAGCDVLTRRRIREKEERPGAIWHIYRAGDADKIRDLLNKVALERGARLEPHHDPIHDQSWYLDRPLRERLYKEYGVDGYAIIQCLGDAVFIPAGAPHQVRNLQNCIKVAEDFVSPENVSQCFHLTQEFRELSDTHSNHEDKLQIKNIIYHAVKDSLSVLVAHYKKEVPSDDIATAITTESSAKKVEVKEEETPVSS